MKKSFGDRSFSVAAPTLWNALPASLRNIDSILTFKSCLKGPLTDLFEPLLRKIYSHITSSFLISSELFHVF